MSKPTREARLTALEEQVKQLADAVQRKIPGLRVESWLD